MLFSLFDWLTITILNIISIIACFHALMTKQDPRSALGWIAVCLALPGLGVLLYVMFGINRIQVTANYWESKKRFHRHRGDAHESDASAHFVLPEPVSTIPDFERMKHMGDRICGLKLLTGCQVDPLYTGSEAYPAMIQAISEAQHTVYLSTYIFGTRGIGKKVIKALEAAHQRGVQVRVLIDGIGNWYAWPTPFRSLKKCKVPVALFLPPLRSWSQTLHLNLRNHRKLLIVDSQIAFTGGMNIHKDDFDKQGNPPKILDLHFRVQGAVVAQLEDCFARSWYFATHEALDTSYIHVPKIAGDMMCRGVDDGPHRALPRYSLLVRNALSSARESVKIMTPYLILDETMRTALNTAALRGVKVQIILPWKNNLKMVKAASEWLFPTLVKCDVEIFYRQGNFAHSKLLIMDDQYVLLGSSNLDNRSMHLNFEFDMEVFSQTLAEHMLGHFEAVKVDSERVTAKWLNKRSFLRKVRNAFCNLFSPYM